MKQLCMIAIAAIVSGSAVAGPFDQLKGKIKPGLYEYNMQMEIPGMPGGMGKQSHTMQHCVTPQDVDGGEWAKNKQQHNCDIQDMKVSGNTASYKMVCKGEGAMTADTKITFRGDGYTSDMKMTMNHGGQAMTSTNHMDAKYLGACK